MRELLDYQADQIERVCLNHRLPVRVAGGTVTPRLVQFRLCPGPGVKLSRLESLAEDLALALGAPSCRLQRQADALALEVPRDDTLGTVRLLSLTRGLSSPPPFTATLGLERQGKPLLLRLSSPEVAHVLIAGTTGSGKTELARSMIISLVMSTPPERLRLLLVDPKGRAFRAFDPLPHLVCPAIADVAAAQARLEGLVAEMERRDRLGISEPRLVVFLDELADLLLVGGKAMENALARLVARGRECGVHVVGCTQRPSAGVLGGLVRANFPCRLVGKVASVEDGRIAAGVGGTSAERLAGRGDFLLVVRGEMRRFQAGYASAADVRQVVAELAEGRWPVAGMVSQRAAGTKATTKALSPPLPGFLRLIKM